MRRIVEPMHPYGTPEFDRKYIEWGLHSRTEQVEQAQAVLRIVPADHPLRILDLACGIGIHATCWAGQGHRVTAVDLSETFITKARELASQEGVSVDFQVGDIRHLPYRSEFDVVTWIETSFFDEQIIEAIRAYLAPGGMFVTNVRNPEHPRYKQRSGNWRTWREKDGVLHLERHETNPATGLREDVWIEIDPAADLVREKRGEPFRQSDTGRPNGHALQGGPDRAPALHDGGTALHGRRGRLRDLASSAPTQVGWAPPANPGLRKSPRQTRS